MVVLHDIGMLDNVDSESGRPEAFWEVFDKLGVWKSILMVGVTKGVVIGVLGFVRVVKDNRDVTEVFRGGWGKIGWSGERWGGL